MVAREAELNRPVGTFAVEKKETPEIQMPKEPEPEKSKEAKTFA